MEIRTKEVVLHVGREMIYYTVQVPGKQKLDFKFRSVPLLRSKSTYQYRLLVLQALEVVCQKALASDSASVRCNIVRKAIAYLAHTQREIYL